MYRKDTGYFAMYSTPLFKRPYASFIEITEHSTQYNNSIPKIADIYLLEAIMIPNKYDLGIIEYFEIFIGYSLIITIPFYLLLKLSNIQRTPTHNIICIPKSIFSSSSTFNGFPLYLLMENLTVKLHSNYDIKYSLIQKYTFIHSDILNDLKKQSNDKTIETNINNFIDIPFTNKNGIGIRYNTYNSSGFFIKTNKELKKISFSLHGQTCFGYDNFLIQFIGKTIFENKWTVQHKKALYASLKNILPNDMINIINNFVKVHEEYLYWIPIEPHEDWNKEIYYKMKVDDFTIKFDDIYSGCVYFIDYKILQIRHGHANLEY